MNTPLYSTKTRKPKTDIEYVDYNSIEEIINDLFLASTLPHDEYDSVKLYGDSMAITFKVKGKTVVKKVDGYVDEKTGLVYYEINEVRE